MVRDNDIMKNNQNIEYFKRVLFFIEVNCIYLKKFREEL